MRPPGIEQGFAALHYEGVGRRLVAALKFGRLLIAAELGAALIAARAPAGSLGGAIVPVPAAPIRLARRGFDPAMELAWALAGSTGLPIAPVLRRRDLGRQRGRDRAQRLRRGPRIGCPGAAPVVALLIDDVSTTGATLAACAEQLRAAGSVRVRATVLAAVPPPGSHLPAGARAA